MDEEGFALFRAYVSELPKDECREFLTFVAAELRVHGLLRAAATIDELREILVTCHMYNADEVWNGVQVGVQADAPQIATMLTTFVASKECNRSSSQ